MIRQGERFGAQGPECRGSLRRVKLRTSEQIHREYECPACSRVLRVRVSERTGEATVPRHRVEKTAAELQPGDLVNAPACPVCGSDLWTLQTGELWCYGQPNGKDCTEKRELPR